jgi:hypothetical protein
MSNNKAKPSGGPGNVRSSVAEQLKTAQRRHHGKEAHADVRGSEHRRDDVETFLQSPARWMWAFL